MSARTRLVLGLGSLAGLGALLVWAVAGLPDFGDPRGPYADPRRAIMLDERHVANAVTGITFDLRGFDTLGEELILFVAALGAARPAARAPDRGRERGGGGVRGASAGRARRRPARARRRARRARAAARDLRRRPRRADAGRRLPGRRPARGGAAARVRRRAGRGGRAGAAGRRSSRSTEALGAAAYTLVALGGLVFGVAVMDNFLPFGTTGPLPLGRHRAGAERGRGGRGDRRRDADPVRVPRPGAAARRGGDERCSRTSSRCGLLVVGLYGVITSRHLVHLVLCLA